MTDQYLRLATRLNIVAYETVGLGAFVILLAFLENEEAGGNPVATNFAWVFWLVGVILIVVGLESASLIRRLPKDPITTATMAAEPST